MRISLPRELKRKILTSKHEKIYNVKVLINLKGGRVYESFCNHYHIRCFDFQIAAFVERAKLFF